MTRKPCRNSRFTSPPRTITLPDGNTIVEQGWELTPGYGRTNVEFVTQEGVDIDAQTEAFIKMWEIPSDDVRRRLTDPRNPSCPLSRFVGNIQAKNIMQRAAFAAWGRPNHCCADLSFAMVGPASSGKTTLARLFGETVRIPFIEVPPRGLRDSNEFFQHIAVTLEKTLVIRVADNRIVSLKMVKPDPFRESDPTMIVPPCIVFIDEVHGLPTNLRENLLKAIESKDRMLNIEGGWYADCQDVCWIVATTERGKLFGPFDSRFTKVELEMYGAEEIAQIVNLDHPHWNMPLCRLVAQYSSRMPREALDFAKSMVQEYELNGGDTESVAARVARSLRIDRYGLTRRRLNVLVALGQVGAVSKGRMADYAGCGIEELEKFVMPALLVATTEDPAMVAVSSRGYAITWRGLEELDKRGIPHRGEEVVAEGGQRLDFGGWNPDDFGTQEESAALVPSPPKKRRTTFSDLVCQVRHDSPPPVPVPPTITVPSMAPPVITLPTIATPPAPRTFAECCRAMVRLLEK
jgi:Holliday junction resolvasome RuvABC ATP-dependent DNA helicase subunit